MNEPGRYAVALQIEDFSSPESISPWSSIPLQFVVLIFVSNQSCSAQPEFVGSTPPDGSCIGIPLDTSWNASIIARIPNGSQAESIIDIVTASPVGMRQSTLANSSDTGEWYIDVTWTPSTLQIGPNIFCYSALDNTL